MSASENIDLVLLGYVGLDYKKRATNVALQEECYKKLVVRRIDVEIVVAAINAYGFCANARGAGVDIEGIASAKLVAQHVLVHHR